MAYRLVDLSHMLIICSLVHLVLTSHTDPSISLREGRNGIVPCNNELEEGKEVAWYKDTNGEQKFIISQDRPHDGYDISPDGALVIKNVTKENEGDYMCKGANPGRGVFVEVKGDDELQPVYLEQGKRGVVPFFPGLYNQFSPDRNDPNEVVYWYSGPIESNDNNTIMLVNSRWKRTNGAYSMNSDNSLVIDTFSKDKEGIYSYELRPRHDEVPPEEIHVRVRDANYPRRIYLERGQKGTVPFPANWTTPPTGQDGYTFWYHLCRGHESAPERKLVATRRWQEEESEEKVDDAWVFHIDSDWNLVIRVVTDSDEGTYSYEVMPRSWGISDGQVNVTVKVSPESSRPVVEGCDDSLAVGPAECQMDAPEGDLSLNLTCVFRHAKPPVDLAWYILREDGGAEDVQQVSREKKITVLPPDSTDPESFQVNNTYTTKATIQIKLPVSDGRYACVATGAAVRNPSENNMTVTIRSQVSGSSTSKSEVTEERLTDSGNAGTTRIVILLSVAGGVLAVIVILIICLRVYRRDPDRFRDYLYFERLKRAFERYTRREIPRDDD